MLTCKPYCLSGVGLAPKLAELLRNAARNRDLLTHVRCCVGLRRYPMDLLLTCCKGLYQRLLAE